MVWVPLVDGMGYDHPLGLVFSDSALGGRNG